ncbi:MAG: winged helix DNA-binding domain-containing protein [Chloroflexota bacterium]
MSTNLTMDTLRRLRLDAQLLLETSRTNDPAEVVRQLCALQAQELPSAHLAIRARSQSLTQQDVQHAREVERSIVLMWSARGTMHLVAAEDVSWQLALFGDHVIKKTERRYKQLGLDASTRDKATLLIVDLLGEHGPQTRAQIAQSLAKSGIPVEGQAIHHLVRYAALRGRICFGPVVDNELTYVVLDDWLHNPLDAQIDTDKAVRELAGRYLRAFGPATLNDFRRWSGLSASQAKAGFKAIADALNEVSIGGESAWMLTTARTDLPATPSVRFLPRYDNYLLGYEHRDFMVDADHASKIHAGGGLIRESLVIDGLAQATWRLDRRRKTPQLRINVFTHISAAQKEQILIEVEQIRRFLAIEAEVEVFYDEA